MKMVIVFKGGAVLSVDVREYQIRRGPDGDVVQLNWTSIDRAPGVVSLRRIDLESIAAIATSWEEVDISAPTDNGDAVLAPEPPSEDDAPSSGD